MGGSKLAERSSSVCERGDHWVRSHRSGRWLEESSFCEEVGLEWVEETEGDGEVEIDKSLKKFT